MEKERIEKMKKSEFNPIFVFVHPKSIGSLIEWLKTRLRQETYKNLTDEGRRTLELGPHTFQAQDSTPDFSTLDFSTMNPSTMYFTTPDFSTTQDEYFQKQLKLIRAYIDFGTLENFDLLIDDDNFDCDIDEQVDQLINLLLPNLPERLSFESKLKYLDFGISLPIKIDQYGTNDKKTDKQVVEKLTSSCHFLQKLSLAGQGYLNFYVIRNICKNGKTLQALDLSRCYGLADGAFRDIVKNCDHLLELNLDFVGEKDGANSNNISSESVSFLSENLTPKIMKLSLLNQNNVGDEHVKTLLTRCNRITEFNICSFKITYIVATYVAQNLSNSLVKLGIELPMSTRRISRAMLNELKSMSKLKHVCIPPWNYYEELKVLYPFIDFSEQRFQIAMPYSNNEQETKFKLWDICAKQSDLF